MSDAEYDRALHYLYEQINYERLAGITSGYPFRLRRMSQLLRQLGLAHFLHPGVGRRSEPEGVGASGTPGGVPATIPLVHIAGTKGKGSTAALVAGALTASGLRTGLYTSPHLHRLEERFRVDGRLCEPAEFVELVTRVRTAAKRLVPAGDDDPSGAVGPSFFELTTAMAFLHFHLRRCDVAVVEVGLGGRLDSTNVCRPSVTAITSIGLDHQHVLGETLEEIAAEKAGIIKPGVPVISGVRRPPTPARAGRRSAQTGGAATATQDPAGVIARIAVGRGAPLQQIGVDFDIDAIPLEAWGRRVLYREQRPGRPAGPTEPSLPGEEPTVSVDLALEGVHQAHNAAIAIAILRTLARQGLPTANEQAWSAMGRVQVAARVERFRLPRDGVGIIDAAHNPDSIAALCETLRERFAGRPVTVVFGTSRDKPASTMLKQLESLATRMYLTRFRGNPRFVDPEELMRAIPEPRRGDVSVRQDPGEACREAIATLPAGGCLVVCGSFFLAAETREIMLGVAGPN